VPAVNICKTVYWLHTFCCLPISWSCYQYLQSYYSCLASTFSVQKKLPCDCFH